MVAYGRLGTYLAQAGRCDAPSCYSMISHTSLLFFLNPIHAVVMGVW